MNPPRRQGLRRDEDDNKNEGVDPSLQRTDTQGKPDVTGQSTKANKQISSKDETYGPPPPYILPPGVAAVRLALILIVGWLFFYACMKTDAVWTVDTYLPWFAIDSQPCDSVWCTRVR